jgi:hypothetical protein
MQRHGYVVFVLPISVWKFYVTTWLRDLRRIFLPFYGLEILCRDKVTSYLFFPFYCLEGSC